jgi:hypothetical protein
MFVARLLSLPARLTDRQSAIFRCLEHNVRFVPQFLQYCQRSFCSFCVRYLYLPVLISGWRNEPGSRAEIFLSLSKSFFFIVNKLVFSWIGAPTFLS